MNESGMKESVRDHRDDGQNSIAFSEISHVENQMSVSTKGTKGSLCNGRDEVFNPLLKRFAVTLPRLIFCIGVAFPIEVWGRGENEIYFGRAEIFGTRAVDLDVEGERLGECTIPVNGAWLNVSTDVVNASNACSEKTSTKASARVPDATAGKTISFVDKASDRRPENGWRSAVECNGAQNSMGFDGITVSKLEAYSASQHALVVPGATGTGRAFPGCLKTIWKEATAYPDSSPIAGLNDSRFVDVHAKCAQLLDVALNLLARSDGRVWEWRIDQLLHNFVNDDRVRFDSFYAGSIGQNNFSRSTAFDYDGHTLSTMLRDDSIYSAWRDVKSLGQLIDLYTLCAVTHQLTLLGFGQFHLLPFVWGESFYVIGDDRLRSSIFTGQRDHVVGIQDADNAFSSFTARTSNPAFLGSGIFVYSQLFNILRREENVEAFKQGLVSVELEVGVAESSSLGASNAAISVYNAAPEITRLYESFGGYGFGTERHSVFAQAIVDDTRAYTPKIGGASVSRLARFFIYELVLRSKEAAQLPKMSNVQLSEMDDKFRGALWVIVDDVPVSEYEADPISADGRDLIEHSFVERQASWMPCQLHTSLFKKREDEFVADVKFDRCCCAGVAGATVFDNLISGRIRNAFCSHGITSIPYGNIRNNSYTKTGAIS